MQIQARNMRFVPLAAIALLFAALPAFAQEPRLNGVHLQISVGSCHDCGVDSTSGVDFQVLDAHGSQAASYHLAQTKVNDGENFERDLNVLLHLTKDQVNHSQFYLHIIQPRKNDHDHFEGEVRLTLKFSDGSACAFHYGDFKIGTYRESSDTRKPIHLDCP